MKKLITASITDGFVGIWWYKPSDEVWAFLRNLDDGYNTGDYIQYDKEANHFSLWRSATQRNIADAKKADEQYSKGYKSLERGRVIFNLRTQSYEILCSKNIFADDNFRQSIINAFNLKGCRYDFVPLNHYTVAELTGNPALDKFYYENQQ